MYPIANNLYFELIKNGIVFLADQTSWVKQVVPTCWAGGPTSRTKVILRSG